MFTPKLLPLLLLAALTACASSGAGRADGAPGASAAAERVSRDGISWVPDPAWVTDVPDNDFRLAQYTLPGEDGAPSAELVIYYFGPAGAGGVQANLDRWRGQFASPGGDGAEGTTELRKVGDLTLHTLDIQGTYRAETPPGSGQIVTRQGQRLLAAIAVTPAGAYYFKLLGPAQTVSQWEGSWRRFVESMLPAAVEAERESV